MSKKNKFEGNIFSYCRVGKYEQLLCEGLRVVIYARNSCNAKQLEKQVRTITDFCQNNDLEVVALQQEIGSGKRFFRFPLQRAIRNKEAEAIVVSDVSRISRKQNVSARFISKIYKRNKFLISAEYGDVISFND